MSLQSSSARQWLIAYDVTDAGRRRRLAALLEGCAVRVQRSVFRADCTQAEIVGILGRCARWVREDDRICAWPVIVAPGQPARWRRKSGPPGYWIV